MLNGIFRNNLKRRIALIISALIFLTALCVSVLSYMRFEKEYSTQAVTDSEDLLKQVAINVQNYLEEISELCLSPYYSTEVMKQLEKSPTDGQELLNKKRTIEDYLQEVMIIPRKDIIRVYICADSVYSSTKTGRKGITGDYEQEEWYKNALKEDGFFLSTYTEKSGNQEYTVLSVAKQIADFRDATKPLGVIRVDANYSGIDGLLSAVKIGDNSAIMILDANDRILSYNSNMADMEFVQEICDKVKFRSSGVYEIEGKNYFITKAPVVTMDWKIIEIRDRDLHRLFRRYLGI